MLKSKATRLTIVFHLLVLLMAAIFTINRSDIQKQHYIESSANVLHSISKSVSVIGSKKTTLNLIERYQQGAVVDNSDVDYLSLSTDFRHILLTNGLEDCELSFIVLNGENQELTRLVSSDRLYGFGEKVVDRNGLIQSNLGEGGSALIAVNEDIKKIMAFDPVKDSQGKVIGLVRIETGDRSAQLTSACDMSWIMPPTLLYLLIATLFTFILTRKGVITKGPSEEETISYELKKKNNELRMLSLVAEKSENLMLITDERGHILWVNETYEEKNNFSADELNEFTGKYLHEVSQNENIRTIIKNVVDFNEPITYESSSKDPIGNNHYAMTTVTPISDEQGYVSNLLFVDTDITKMKHAERQQSLFKKLVDYCDTPQLLVSDKGKILYANEASDSLVKYWCDSESVLKNDILAMLTSVYDIGNDQTIGINISGVEMKLVIHPESEIECLMIIAERIIEENSTNRQNLVSDRQFREAG